MKKQNNSNKYNYGKQKYEITAKNMMTRLAMIVFYIIAIVLAFFQITGGFDFMYTIFMLIFLLWGGLETYIYLYSHIIFYERGLTIQSFSKLDGISYNEVDHIEIIEKNNHPAFASFINKEGQVIYSIDLGQYKDALETIKKIKEELKK